MSLCSGIYSGLLQTVLKNKRAQDKFTKLKFYFLKKTVICISYQDL